MKKRNAFTLIELLVVIAIIGILVSLLFPALRSALNKAKRMTALTEVKSIETALKKYYQEYSTWPSVAAGAQENALPIQDDIAKILHGYNLPDNPKRIMFMEFGRTNLLGNPVNPWGSKDPSINTDENYYYAKLDTDFDNEIPMTGGTMPNDQPTASVRATVLVWTYDPKRRDKPDYVIRSWGR